MGMLHGFGDFCVFHRSKSKVSTYGTFLAIFFCLFSLIAGAQDDPITDPMEVKALQDIKRNLVDPNKNLTNWNRGDPCTSNWTGVLCFNTTLKDGYLHVRELQLLNMNLSGTLSPELGHLSQMTILDFMWNNITGSIPKEIGNITSLVLLLLNGNHLTGPLPDELGYLPNLDRIQIDQNQISGPIPKSFANLNKTKHFHMNNNSLSGQIPPELSRLPSLVHFLLDNNNLSGYLPPEFSELPKLLILQVDNNNFDGTTIPHSYGNMSKLLKMSLRNCSLQGTIPDLSNIPGLGYLDLSSNKLNGSIPTNKLSENITTIDLSNNNLSGTIPANFSGLVNLQRLSLANNSMVGSVSSDIWQNRTVKATERLDVDLQNNQFVNISGSTSLPQNVSVWLQGNPLCLNSNLVQFCQSKIFPTDSLQNMTSEDCPSQSCPPPYEYSVLSPVRCFCAAPLLVGYRLKSPGFSYFDAYENVFLQYLSEGLVLYLYQVQIDSFSWQQGPRLKMYIKIFPVYQNESDSHLFNGSEVLRIRRMFTGWNIPDSDLFGPYELLNFTLLEPYQEEFPTLSSSGISKGALVGIVLGAIAGAVTLSAIVSLFIMRKHLRDHHGISKRRRSSTASIKIDGVKCFAYGELASATNNFSSSTQVGQGGYGKVYRGVLADGTVVAIKRAQEGSLQGEREFLTEIELLSRLHHRNLVSLIGYCEEEGEQMLIYEFMSKGTLRDHISGRSKDPVTFGMRLRIALGSAKGILYLHSEADPPIFHRDIKASNILLDSNFTAKVADFGLSRLAPVPDIEGVIPAHVSTVVKGTPGYLDPEYFLTHKLTDKSDVYSLGVVFLELLTGMQPISHGKNIVREVNTAYQSGTISSIVDGSMGSYPSECVEKFLMLALTCCRDETDARPSMADVVRELESIWLMTPKSDGRTTESISIEATKKMTPPSSSSEIMNPNVSYDVSGSDLISGVTPTVTPR
ncbi:probable LRR receptor-like serine/threonine-protein kinase At1g06840 [Rhodamnia argentea]|uniref:non-specific serine/threonine protein kinase n=1 Tax=Rhodamnia argentea TaxID=178133 RepID=A0A8B8NQ80_9MYRT|nr:probable LRR receptor-like serine/threonine-protein kinase At1g06840 [Rhodamnia argentea]XP_030524317.1 probable LRR receptor-like serine/threonine-protein kinase At1g06840 [Rhodamnia argentea]